MTQHRNPHVALPRRRSTKPAMRLLCSRVALSTALLLACAGASQAQVSLASLLGGGTITVPTSIPGASLFFSNFSDFTAFATAGADAPTPAEIFVTPTLPGTGHVGLRWQSAKWNVDVGQTMDTAWEYDVSTIGPVQIDGAELHFVSHAEINGASDHVSQTLTNLADGLDQSMLLDSLTGLNSTATSFPPTHFVHVAKDVGLEGHSGQSAISTFDQHFDVVPTPEPGTYAMFVGMGVTGIFATTRRLRKRTNKK